MCKRQLSLILAAMVFACVWPSTAKPADPSLVGWWKLDDGAGTVAVDSSGKGNNGVLMEGPGTGSTAAGTEGHGPNWITGKIGGALSFDGVNDYVNLAPAGSSLPTVLASLTDCTFTVWADFHYNAGSWQRIWELSDTGANVIYLSPCQGTSGPMRFGICGGGSAEQLVDSSLGTLAGGWHHIAMTIKQVVTGQSTYTMFLDGVQVGQNASGTFVPNRPAGTAAFTECWLARPRWQNDTYFSGSIDDFQIYSKVLSPSEIQIVMLGSAGIAFGPSPKDGATDVLRDAAVTWTPGQYAKTHDVYFGTVFSDVNSASRANPKGALVSQGQDANTYDPPGLLQLGQTYYWRIDEVNAPPTSSTIFKGVTWSFTVEPVGYAITNITATASSGSASTGPQNTVNGSGMTGDLHSTDSKTMWLSGTSPQPTWIRYDFDRVYKLQELWVWNQNTLYEAALGFGIKNATIEYSSDGTTWTKLGDFVFAQAPGAEGYAHNTTIPFGGIAAKAVRITATGASWGGRTQYGLSEVRFLYIPVWAREPKPASGSAGVNPPVTLSWRPGRGAVSHNVYVGTDSNAVRASTTPAGTATTASYTPAAIDLSATYYWRVDEVNAAETVTTWPGDVWSFSTPDYLTVDDFESYNDTAPARIFDAWVDGYGTTTNGSQVGYTTAPFAERTIVHSGRQSMPFAYNNTSATNSEATRTFDVAQDWTIGGVKTLVLYFRGVPANTTGQLFVKINGTKVNYAGNAAGETSLVWKQWNIDLTAVSGLNAVKTLTIGVSGAGKGILYIDDIRLYKSAPAVITPTDPGTTGLVAYYAMEGDAKDSVGGYNGTLNNVTFAASLTGFGNAAQFNGTTGYIDLGASFGNLIATLNSATLGAWVNYAGTGAVWQRVIDCGNGGTTPQVYIFLTTRNGSSYPRFALTKTSNGGEAGATSPSVLSVGWHHLAGVIDASTMRIALYVDGALAQGNVATTILPKDLGKTTQNWLGRSQWSADPYLNGALDEVRIFNRALSEGEVRYLAGDR